MNQLIEIICADDNATRHQSIASVCLSQSCEQLLEHAAELDAFRRNEPTLYRRVRALFFLAAMLLFMVAK